MFFLMSLLIQTGDLSENYIIRLMVFFSSFVILHIYREEESLKDYQVEVREHLFHIDYSKIPKECQESFTDAFILLDLFRKNHGYDLQNISFYLVYLHEEKASFERGPASCSFNHNRYKVFLSRTLLTKNKISHDELKYVLYHELGHFLCREIESKDEMLDFARVFLLSILMANLASFCDQMLIENESFFHHMNLVIATAIVLMLLIPIVKKIQRHEFAADHAGILNGNIHPEIAVQTLQKLCAMRNQNRNILIKTLFMSNSYFFCTHPDIVSRSSRLRSLIH